MKSKHVLFFSMVCLLAISLGACEKEALDSRSAADDDLQFRSNAQPAGQCFNFHYAAEAVPLSFNHCFPAPFEQICGFGALPTEVEIGSITGDLSSIVTSQRPSGRGATHYGLMHYFSDGQGNTFWTEDRAVCAPAGKNPYVCRVNDVMKIAGGTGVFAQANGSVRNHGVIDLSDLSNPKLSIDLRGRICGDGL